jgi:serine/threonine protein kinase
MLAMRERAILNKLRDHKSIIKVCWSDEREGRHQDYLLLVMPYSPTLNEFIKSKNGGRISVEVAKSIFVQLIGAVRYLHRFGFIHADIKPENICIKEKKRSGRLVVKLIDFGSVSRKRKSRH